MRLEATGDSSADADTVRDGAPNTVGGAPNNFVTVGVVGATIGGGGATNFFGSPAANSVKGDYATIGGGLGNTIESSARFNVIAGGSGNSIHSGKIGSSDYATIGGGRDNSIQPDAAYATIPGGRYASANNYGQIAYASGRFSASGDAQTSRYVLRQTTTGDLNEPVYLDGVGREMVVPRNSSWMFDILIVARSDSAGAAAGLSAGWHIRGLVDNNGGSMSIEETDRAEFGNDGRLWEVFLGAFDQEGQGVLRILVNGEPSVTIRWVATVRTVEVIH